MEFPKDVICIHSGNWADLKTGIIMPGPHPILNNVYKALGINDTLCYAIEGFERYRYKADYFRDLNDINIEEVTEILKEEPCLI